MSDDLVVEEVVIVEECGSDEEGEWVMGDDGEWYMVVEEYEEELGETDSVCSSPEKSEVVDLLSPRSILKRSSSLGILDKKDDVISSSASVSDIHGLMTSSERITRKKGGKFLFSGNNKKRKSPKPKKKEKKAKQMSRGNSEATLALKNDSPLSKFRAKHQAASNRIAISNRLEGIRSRAKQEKLFGEPLENLLERDTKRGLDMKSKPPSSVPYLVYYLVEHIRERGLNTSGLFRECGRHATQLQKESMIESGIPFDDLELVNRMNLYFY